MCMPPARICDDAFHEPSRDVCVDLFLETENRQTSSTRDGAKRGCEASPIIPTPLFAPQPKESPKDRRKKVQRLKVSFPLERKFGERNFFYIEKRGKLPPHTYYFKCQEDKHCCFENHDSDRNINPPII